MTPEIKKRIDDFLKDKGTVFGYLHDRWQDEHEYEDFQDYINRAKKALPEDFEFVKMTKRPFAITFKYEGMKFQIVVNTRTILWKEAR